MKGEVLIEKNQQLEHLLIINEGKIKDDEKKIYSSGFIHEIGLFLYDGQAKTNYYVMEDNTECFLLTKERFFTIID